MDRKLKVSFGPQKWQIITGIILIASILIFSLFYYLYDTYTVTEVSVTGNVHYTTEQIQDIVMTGRLGHNSLYLSMKYRNKSIEGVPFVETMDVEILSPTSISITVYEKTIAGCVEYLDRYIFFDKDGIAVESSMQRQMDIPLIKGLEFDHVVLYEKLPIENEEVFKNILTMTQLLSKYQIQTDQIYFDSESQVSIYFDKAKVLLGTMDDIDEKMLKLQGIIPQLEGMDGTLYMNNYSDDGDSKYITFQRNDVKQHSDLSIEMITGVSGNSISDVNEEEPDTQKLVETEADAEE